MKKIIWVAFLIFTVIPAFSAGIERFAIYVGSNKGTAERETLLYAGTDAQNIQNVMQDIGGISKENSCLLINPAADDIEFAVQNIAEKISSKKHSASRTEFLFYYSGHSDEDGLLLGNQNYDYLDLKKLISDVPSDIHVVILDSCFSGNFIRAKGGTRKKPFLFDDSSVVQGHAYLSSSSEKEFSQESDEIEASYFTNAIVSGLRGAADSSGDKKVTLNELYSYAFNDTLKKTETTNAGPQHPNFNITLVGSGDLVLSDFSDFDSSIIVGKRVTGSIIIRDENQRLISEINKTENTEVQLALPQGNYSVLLSKENSSSKGNIVVQKGNPVLIDGTTFKKIDRKTNTVRGTSASVTEADYIKVPDERTWRVDVQVEDNIALFGHIYKKGDGLLVTGLVAPSTGRNTFSLSADFEFPSENKHHFLAGMSFGLGNWHNLGFGLDLGYSFNVVSTKYLAFNIVPKINMGADYDGVLFGKIGADFSAGSPVNKGFYGYAGGFCSVNYSTHELVSLGDSYNLIDGWEFIYGFGFHFGIGWKF